MRAEERGEEREECYFLFRRVSLAGDASGLSFPVNQGGRL